MLDAARDKSRGSGKLTRYNTISLFSGAMGLDLGLEKTGKFQTFACVEKEAAFCQTIRSNRDAGRLRRDLAVFEGDISEIDPLTVLDAVGLKRGEVDLLVGGPPCQSFSTAGRRRTVTDPRGTLLWEFLRFVDAIQPRFFLMENVRGLLSAALRHRPIADRPDKGGPPLSPEEEPGSVVRLFADDLAHLDHAYRMDCFEVNAVNYGAPQLRERVLFVGNRYGAVVDFPDPTHGGPDATNSEPDLFGAQHALKPWRTLGDAIRELNDPGSVIMDFSARKKAYLSMVPPGSNWRSLPKEIQQESMGRAWHAKGGRSGWWRRLSFDLPCPTLVTMPNHAGTSLCHPDHVRALSLLEYALIQEFPRDWEFCGTTAEQYTQAGNAVPVRLGQVAGNILAASLDSLAANAWKPNPASLEPFRVIYVQSHVRTRRWFKSGRTFVWSDTGTKQDASYSVPVTRRKTKLVTQAGS